MTAGVVLRTRLARAKPELLEMRKKEILARMLERTGVTSGLLALGHYLPLRRLTILTYHSVGDVSSDYPFDPEVIDATVEAFAAHLELVQRRFQVVGVAEVCEAFRTGTLPRDAVMITFDDGYKSCYERALPLLVRYGLPATFFIATDFVEHRRLFWWDAVNYLIKTCTRQRLQLHYPTAISLPLGDRSTAIASILHLVKSTVGIDPRRFVAHLAEAAQLPWDDERERTLADQLIMTWAEVRALSEAGMDVQAHTRTHRVLQTLSAAEYESEFEGCRLDLERVLGKRVRSIAYPVGFPIDQSSALCAAVRAAGYEVGFTNGTGINLWAKRPSAFAIKRVAIDREESLSMFRARLALPGLS